MRELVPSPARVEAELDDRGQGPGGSTELHREREGGQAVIGVEDRAQPGGDLEPERGGHGVLRQGPTDHRSAPVGLGQVGQPTDLLPQLATYGRHGVPQQHHQGGVDDVLAGEAPVHPAGRVPLEPVAQDRHQPDHRVARGLRGDHRGVEVGERAVVDAEHVEPGLLDVEHRPEERPLRQVVASPGVTGPEQVVHGLSLAQR